MPGRFYFKVVTGNILSLPAVADLQRILARRQLFQPDKIIVNIIRLPLSVNGFIFQQLVFDGFFFINFCRKGKDDIVFCRRKYRVLQRNVGCGVFIPWAF